MIADDSDPRATIALGDQRVAEALDGCMIGTSYPNMMDLLRVALASVAGGISSLGECGDTSDHVGESRRMVDTTAQLVKLAAAYEQIAADEAEIRERREAV